MRRLLRERLISDHKHGDPGEVVRVAREDDVIFSLPDSVAAEE